MSRPTSISWGDSAIDLVLPKPKVPSVLLIDQHRKEFQGALLRMVANDLSESIPVHWIDGGNRFDPTRFFSSLQSLNHRSQYNYPEGCIATRQYR